MVFGGARPCTKEWNFHQCLKNNDRIELKWITHLFHMMDAEASHASFVLIQLETDVHQGQVPDIKSTLI